MFGSFGRIDSEGTVEQTVWCQLVALIFVVPTWGQLSHHTSLPRRVVFDMRSLFAFKLETLCGFMVPFVVGATQI